MNDIQKILILAGCSLKKNGLKHQIWYSPANSKEFPISKDEQTIKEK
ncbi:MAG: hypothetical protein GYA87_09875 [Christensenellaceae bacterium]|nr:hypothetical protein [Christensenellaceae bacterium]